MTAAEGSAAVDTGEEERSPASPTFARHVLTTVSIVAAAAILIVLTWYARQVLLLAFAGLLVAVFLRRLSTWVGGLISVSPRWGLVLVIVVLISALTAAFTLRGDAIAAEVSALREELPRAVNSLRARLQNLEWGQRVIDAATERMRMLPNEPDLVGQVTGVASRTLSLLTSMAFVLFLGIVLAATPHVYRAGLLALVPQQHVPRAEQLIERLYAALWWWLVGRFISMAFVGVTTGIGLWLLGIPLAFILGLLAALLSFIPNIGPVVSAIPAVLLALVGDARSALWVVLLYIGVQIVESFALAPYIDRKTVYLPPGLTVFAQLLLALVGGLIGVALATPLTAAVVVVVTMLYVQDVLGRRDIKVQTR